MKSSYPINKGRPITFSEMLKKSADFTMVDDVLIADAKKHSSKKFAEWLEKEIREHRKRIKRNTQLVLKRIAER